MYEYTVNPEQTDAIWVKAAYFIIIAAAFVKIMIDPYTFITFKVNSCLPERAVRLLLCCCCLHGCAFIGYNMLGDMSQLCNATTETPITKVRYTLHVVAVSYISSIKIINNSNDNTFSKKQVSTHTDIVLNFCLRLFDGFEYFYVSAFKRTKNVTQTY